MNDPFKNDLIEHLLAIGNLFTAAKEDWKARAFFRVASTLKKMEEPITFADGKMVGKIPGAGEAITTVIEEFKATGTSKKLDRLVVQVGDIAPKRVPAGPVKTAVEEIMSGLEGVDWGFAGSMRRGSETVKDVDVIVCLEDESQKDNLAQHFSAKGLTADVRSGEKKWGMTIEVDGKPIVLDLNFCTPENRGAYYLYFTGPKEFCVSIRSIAKAKGMKVNEYGIFKGKTCLASETEDGMLAVLGIPHLEPEERDDYSFESRA